MVSLLVVRQHRRYLSADSDESCRSPLLALLSLAGFLATCFCLCLLQFNIPLGAEPRRGAVSCHSAIRLSSGAGSLMRDYSTPNAATCGAASCAFPESLSSTGLGQLAVSGGYRSM